MGTWFGAAKVVLSEAFRPARRTGDVLDLKEVVGVILRWAGAPGAGAVALLVQEQIPGVRNLYPWAFPLIVFNVALTGLIFVAAVRQEIPKNLARISQISRVGAS